VLGEEQHFIAAAPENERIATLQPQHAHALVRERDEERIDLYQRESMVGSFIAAEDDNCVAAHETENIADH
jgi:hypothetical protein